MRASASKDANNNNNINAGVQSQGKRAFLKKLAMGTTASVAGLSAVGAQNALAADETVASSRMSYSRFLEYLDMDRVKKVDL